MSVAVCPGLNAPSNCQPWYLLPLLSLLDNSATPPRIGLPDTFLEVKIIRLNPDHHPIRANGFYVGIGGAKEFNWCIGRRIVLDVHGCYRLWKRQVLVSIYDLVCLSPRSRYKAKQYKSDDYWLVSFLFSSTEPVKRIPRLCQATEYSRNRRVRVGLYLRKFDESHGSG
jgi:hypothetical protein